MTRRNLYTPTLSLRTLQVLCLLQHLAVRRSVYLMHIRTELSIAYPYISWVRSTLYQLVADLVRAGMIHKTLLIVEHRNTRQIVSLTTGGYSLLHQQKLWWKVTGPQAVREQQYVYHASAEVHRLYRQAIPDAID